MPRGWRFIARSAGSRTPCVEPDAAGTLASVADAFVDRRPIDWRAVHGRATTDTDRAALDALQLIEQLRDTGAPRLRPFALQGVHPAAAGVAALAAVQTAACVLVLIAAWLGGEPIARRVPRISVALSFAASALLLWPASRVDGSSGYLLVAYAAAASAFARAATAS